MKIIFAIFVTFLTAICGTSWLITMFLGANANNESKLKGWFRLVIFAVLWSLFIYFMCKMLCILGGWIAG